MESNANIDHSHASIVNNSPWQASSRDPQSLFGSRPGPMFTPWGWTTQPDGSFTDTITERVSADRPLAPAIEDNFTFKAFGANLCLQDINAFAQTWLSAAPAELNAELAPSIDRVRTAALALVACGATGNQDQRSELDTLLATSRVIDKYPERQGSSESQCSSEIKNLSESTWHLIQMIKGFCVLLQEFNSMDAATAPLQEFRQAWEAKTMDAHAVAIERFCSDRRVLDEVNRLKASTFTQPMSDTAHRLAKDYMSAKDGARRKLDELSAQTPWEGSIVAVKWNKPLPHISRLSAFFRYRGIDRHRILVTTTRGSVKPETEEAIEGAASVSHKDQIFEFADEDNILLYPDSTIQIQLQWIDDGAWRRGPTTKPVDTNFVFGSDVRKRVPGPKRIETELSQHVLELDMPPADISKEYERLDKCHWTSLLSAGPLPDGDSPHKLLFEPSAPRPPRMRAAKSILKSNWIRSDTWKTE